MKSKYNFFKFKITILLLGGGLVICSSLFSCKNFLNAGKTCEEIKESIAYANSKSCTVIVQADSKLGTFLSSGEKECKVGYSINLQFTVNAEDYIFNGLKAVSSKDNSVSRDEYVDFSITSLEEKQNTYSIEVKLLKAAADILIIPDCTLIPKIIDFFPPFVPTGYDQDTTISITFSKPMDTLSFGDFSSITITNEAGQNLDTYFEQPYFSDDNKILNIATKKTKYIIDRQADNIDYQNIVVNFNANGIKDSEGFALSDIKSYTYRINKNVDNVRPVITDLHIYSTRDTSNLFYREYFQKTTRNFEQWEDSDFNNNVTYKPYITIQGYDNSSGIESIHVKETLIKDKNNLELQNDTFEEDYGKDVFAPLVTNEGMYITDSSGKQIFGFSFDYEFHNVTNGLMLIELSLIDRAGNESLPQSYELIYDTTLPRPSQMSGSVTTTNNIKRPNINVCSFNKPTEFYKADGKSYSYTSYFTLEIFEEDKEPVRVKDKVFIENTDKILTWTNEYFRAEALGNNHYNPHKYKFIRFIFEDERACAFDFTTAFPPARDCYVIYDNEGKLAGITRENIAEVEIPDNVENGSYSYTYKESSTGSETTPKTLYEAPKSTVLEFNGSDYSEGIYTFYYRSYIRPGGSPTALSGDYGKVAVYYKGITNPDFDSSIVFPDFSIDTSEIVYERNKETAKGTVDVDLQQNEYTFLISIRSESGKDYVFDTKSFEVKSGDIYYFSLIALNEEGTIVARSAEKAVALNEKDNLPPNIMRFINLNNFFLLDSNHIGYPDLPYDYDETNTRKNNIDKITVFFSGKDLNTNLPVEQITTGYYSKVDVPVDYTKPFLLLPIDGIPEGYYTVNLYIQDNSELKNYKWFHPNPVRFLVYYVNLKPEISIENNKMIITSPVFSEEYFSTLPTNISFNYSSSEGNGNRVFRQYLDKQTKEWIYYKNSKDEDLTDEKMTLNSEKTMFSYTMDLSSGSDRFIKVNSAFIQKSYDSGQRIYFHPVYIYPDYYLYKGTPNEIVCNDTTWIETQNGYQIFCDAPCFVHTMYCSRQLTTTNTPADAEIWETRAIETGIAYSDGDLFSYTDKYLAEIPEGYWYTTIVYFADGTFIMSKVSQK